MKVDSGVDIGEISHLTPGYVAADLTSLIREAALSSVTRILQALDYSSNGSSSATLQSLMAKLSAEFKLDLSLLQSTAINIQDFKVIH